MMLPNAASKPTVICVHGYSMCNLYERFIGDLLSQVGEDQLCVVSYDLWGRGNRSWDDLKHRYLVERSLNLAGWSDAVSAPMNCETFTKQLNELLVHLVDSGEVQ